MNANVEPIATTGANPAVRIFAAMELSKSTWVVAIKLPAVEKISLFQIPGGDIDALVALLEKARQRIGGHADICTCYEAGYDGFWIHRVLMARGIENLVLDSEIGRAHV